MHVDVLLLVASFVFCLSICIMMRLWVEWKDANIKATMSETSCCYRRSASNRFEIGQYFTKEMDWNRFGARSFRRIHKCAWELGLWLRECCTIEQNFRRQYNMFFSFSILAWRKSWFPTTWCAMFVFTQQLCANCMKNIH